MGQSITPCSVPGCEKPSRCRGWCSMHYDRWLKHGDINYVRVYTRAPPKTCSVEGCTSRVTGCGWCGKHYWRMRTYGDLSHEKSFLPTEERFWNKVDRSGTCWLWTAGVDRDGYGLFGLRGRQFRAHRFSYALVYGEIPEGLVVMHSCDRPPCVNPAHLSLGSHAENGADSARKARRRRGSHNAQAKLTEGQVLDLRARYAAGGVTQKELASAFGISHALVSFIVTRKAWQHI